MKFTKLPVGKKRKDSVKVYIVQITDKNELQIEEVDNKKKPHFPLKAVQYSTFPI